jgi:hypothetical protein
MNLGMLSERLAEEIAVCTSGRQSIKAIKVMTTKLLLKTEMSDVLMINVKDNMQKKEVLSNRR